MFLSTTKKTFYTEGFRDDNQHIDELLEATSSYSDNQFKDAFQSLQADYAK